MNPALHYFLLYPKWWYHDRALWWWHFLERTLSLVYVRLGGASHLENIAALRQQFGSNDKPWLPAVTKVAQAIAAGVALGAVSLCLAAACALWFLWPAALPIGIVRGGWNIVGGLLLSLVSFAVYWFSYVLQPKQSITNLDPADVSVDTLMEVSTHQVNQIYKTLPPAFSSAVVIKHLAIDPLIQRIFAKLDLSDQQILPRIMQQAAKNSQVVSLKDYCRQIYNQALAHHRQHITTADLLLGMVKVVPSLQQILSDAGVQYHELVEAVQDVENEQRGRKWSWWHDEEAPVTTPSVRTEEPKGRAATQMVTDANALLAANQLLEAVTWQDHAQQILATISDNPQNHILLVTDSEVGMSALPYELSRQLCAGASLPQLPYSNIIHINPIYATCTSSVQHLANLTRLDEMLTEKTILYINDLHLLTQPHPGTQDILAIVGPQIRSGRVKIVAQTTPTGHRQLLASPLDWIIHFHHVEVAQPPHHPDSLALPVLAIQQHHNVTIDPSLVERSLELSLQHPLPQPSVEVAAQFLALAAEQARQNGHTAPTKQDLIQTVRQQTGLPVETISQSEEERLDRFDLQARENIIGQDEALETVLAVLSNSRAADSASKASLVFVGPSGVGKTELAKTLARTYFGSDDALVRLDIAEFTHADPISALLGSPDSDTEGKLAGALRRQPSSVVFFDNLEKATPELLALLSNMLRQGYILDGAGRIISIQQAVIIVSTTIGARAIEQAISQGYSPRQIVPAVKHLLGERLPASDLLHIVDQIVVFRPLNESDVAQLVKLMLEPILKQASEQGVVVTIDDEVIRQLAAMGYDAKYGARPLRHLIQDKIEHALQQRFQRGELRPGAMLHLDTQLIPM